MSAPNLADRLAARIERDGPIAVSTFVDLALYDPDDGFYATGGRAGRRGDFLTAPEVGPLFGAVVARAVDGWWDRADRPEVWPVQEHGAGPGTLARAVLAAEPECLRAGALHWLAVERSAAQRSQHPDHPAVHSLSDTDLERSPLADAAVGGVVMANELLDNLPFDVVERTDTGWREVLVSVADEGGFVEVGGPAVEVPPAVAAVNAPVGTRLPVQRAAQRWVDRQLRGLAARGGGRLLVFDYGAPTRRLVDRGGGWLRTFRHHDDSRGWLDEPGTADITTDVDLDQIVDEHRPRRMETQAEFLVRHGIDELVTEGRAAWRAGASTGDLAALRGRSRVREAEALLDPDGMGGFVAVHWVV